MGIKVELLNSRAQTLKRPSLVTITFDFGSKIVDAFTQRINLLPMGTGTLVELLAKQCNCGQERLNLCKGSVGRGGNQSGLDAPARPRLA